MRFACFVASAFFVASLASVTAESTGQAMSASPGPAEPGPVATPAALPMPTEAQTEALMQNLGRMQAEQRQLRAQTRERLLAALSPAHRGLVATLLGELAVSPQPDPSATARQLDASLAPSERESILRIEAAALSDSSALARQMQLQIEAQMPPEQRVALERHMAQAKADLERRLTPEQRAALQRANGGSGVPPPFTGALPLVPTGASQDAGSVLLHELTLPAPMPYGIMPSVHAGAGVLIQSVTASPPR